MKDRGLVHSPSSVLPGRHLPLFIVMVHRHRTIVITCPSATYYPPNTIAADTTTAATMTPTDITCGAHDECEAVLPVEVGIRVHSSWMREVDDNEVVDRRFHLLHSSVGVCRPRWQQLQL